MLGRTALHLWAAAQRVVWGRIGLRAWAVGRRLELGMRVRVLRVVGAEEGMSTVEYAIGTIAAAAFGAVLYAVVTGDSIVNALTKIIDKALNTSV
ncbi:hypothetical protein BJ987_000777 [Nocardia goodfellowii]|uniref:DUF4244 domain-containing protein n=2 Tax=Nocardia goodfellowii TaxID=882446 RepID=A0ABS4Q854_9NOCA|nr:hypothetical protein [Nocardia goodfellowii]